MNRLEGVELPNVWHIRFERVDVAQEPAMMHPVISRLAATSTARGHAIGSVLQDGWWGPIEAVDDDECIWKIDRIIIESCREEDRTGMKYYWARALDTPMFTGRQGAR